MQQHSAVTDSQVLQKTDVAARTYCSDGQSGPAEDRQESTVATRKLMPCRRRLQSTSTVSQSPARPPTSNVLPAAVSIGHQSRLTLLLHYSSPASAQCWKQSIEPPLAASL